MQVTRIRTSCSNRTATATTEARRKVYEAAQLTISYDHAGKRAKPHASPDPEVWSSVRVGGGLQPLTHSGPDPSGWTSQQPDQARRNIRPPHGVVFAQQDYLSPEGLVALGAMLGLEVALDA